MYDTTATMFNAMTTGHVAFERRGKLCLLAISDLIIMRHKTYKFYGVPILRVIFEVNNTIEVCFFFVVFVFVLLVFFIICKNYIKAICKGVLDTVKIIDKCVGLVL